MSSGRPARGRPGPRPRARRGPGPSRCPDCPAPVEPRDERRRPASRNGLSPRPGGRTPPPAPRRDRDRPGGGGRDCARGWRGGPSRFQCARDGQRDLIPVRGFFVQLSPSGTGEGVVLGPSVVLGGLPFGREPARLLQAMEGGEEGARLHGEGAARDLLDAARDAEPVEGAGRQGLQDEEIEGTLKQCSARARHWTLLLSSSYTSESTPRSYRMSIGRKRAQGRTARPKCTPKSVVLIWSLKFSVKPSSKRILREIG